MTTTCTATATSGSEETVVQEQATATASVATLYTLSDPSSSHASEAAAWLPFPSPSMSGLFTRKTSSRDAILQPLTFPEALKQDLSYFLDPSKDVPVPCMLCEQTFDNHPGTKAQDAWLRHLLTVHKVVVHRVEDICSLKCYAEYWKCKFTSAPITNFTPVIRTNTRSDHPSEDYYLLSDALAEDKELRIKLQRKRLEAVLEVQQLERLDTNFTGMCLFCSHVCTGNRTVLFQHMLETHNFNVGHADNIVFVEEFLSTLRQKLENLQCLYCEGTFRDHATLKEHMRKKLHKKINPKNKTYDKFYVINYLEFGKNWEEVQSEDDREIINQDDNDWNGWEENQLVPVVCLFCKFSAADIGVVLQHMKEIHSFDFLTICQDMNLEYYSKVKVVNYIRRQVHMHICTYCSQKYQSHEKLLLHMGFNGHFLLPVDRTRWNQPQYLFPTFENDLFLCGLDEDLSDEEKS